MTKDCKKNYEISERRLFLIASKKKTKESIE